MESSGPNYPSTAVDDSGVGTVSWLNPGNVTADDGSVASRSATATLHYIKATNFGFSIPSTATIVGIVVEIEGSWSGTPGNSTYQRVRLVKAGTIQSNDRDAGQSIDSGFSVKTHGSSSELWGGSWSPSDINNSGFGVAFNAVNASTGQVAIDFVRITVYFTTPYEHSGVSMGHGSFNRLGPSNTPGTLSFTGGSGVTTYDVRTAPGGGGTLVGSGSAASGANAKSIAYNASGLAQGANTLYLRTGDGTNWSSSTSFTLRRDDSVSAPSIDGHTPSPVDPSKQYSVQFDAADTYSTNTNEMTYWLRTASGGGGTQLATGTFTQGSNRVTSTVTDSALVEGSNTRYLRIRDGAGNIAETSFTVTAVFNTVPVIAAGPAVAYAEGTSTHEHSTPFAVAFTAEDDEDQGADELTYAIYTGASRTGTLVATGTCTHGVEEIVQVAYDATGLVDGPQTLYLSVDDGDLTSDDESFAVVRQLGVAGELDLRWRVGGRVSGEMDLRWRVGGRVSGRASLLWRVAPSPNRVSWALDGRFGAVVYGWRYERRTLANQLLADVTAAVVRARTDLNNDRDVLRRAEFEIDPTAADDRGNAITIDPLADHVAIIQELLVDGSYWLDLPIGLFALTAPRRRVDDAGTTWTVAASDLSIHLLEATCTSTWSVDAGESFVTGTNAVADILDSLGLRHALPSTSSVLPVARSWPTGTPWLRIVNDLLHAFDAYSLWFTRDGVATSRIRDELAGRTPDVTYSGNDYVLLPIEQEDDTTRFANQVVAVADDPERAPLSSVATNADPSSPISTISLGRTITKVVAADGAADQTTLDAIAQRALEQAASMYQRATLLTPIDPRRDAHEVYRLEVDGVYDGEAWWARNWSAELTVGAQMQHELGRVQRVGS